MAGVCCYYLLFSHNIPHLSHIYPTPNLMNEPIEVLMTLPFPEELVDSLRKISPRLKIHVQRARKPEEIAPEIWARSEVLYTASLLPSPEQSPNLRWIQFHYAGADHAITHAILSRPGVVATTLSGAASSQMAEYILM